MAKTDKPNVLVIMGDDIGWFNPASFNVDDVLEKITSAAAQGPGR